MTNDKPHDMPIVFLSEQEQSQAVRDMYGRRQHGYSHEEIGKACGAAIEQKAQRMYDEGYRNRAFENVKIR